MNKISRYNNVTTKIKDGVLTITINIDPDQVDIQPSASGKTMVIATTGGAQTLSDGSKLNLTLYKKP